MIQSLNIKRFIYIFLKFVGFERFWKSKNGIRIWKEQTYVNNQQTEKLGKHEY